MKTKDGACDGKSLLSLCDAVRDTVRSDLGLDLSDVSSATTKVRKKV